MKKLGRILCLAALIVTMAASVCFGAESLEIERSYPEDGQKNTTIENMCVKLWFNNDMAEKGFEKNNKEYFKLTDKDGNEVPIRVFCHPEDKKNVLVLADTTQKLDIKDNTEYTLTISGKLTDSKGNSLGEDAAYSFTTLNAKRNNAVYMIMMFVMFGGMFYFTSRQMKKQQEADQPERKEKVEAFNPYKEAKRTGKSVQEVIAAHEKEMAKKAKKAKKAEKVQSADEEDAYEEENGNYRVKGPRPISASGSTFITGRKAEAEARKAEEERLAKRRAANAKKKKKK